MEKISQSNQKILIVRISHKLSVVQTGRVKEEKNNIHDKC